MFKYLISTKIMRKTVDLKPSSLKYKNHRGHDKWFLGGPSNGIKQFHTKASNFKDLTM